MTKMNLNCPWWSDTFRGGKALQVYHYTLYISISIATLIYTRIYIYILLWRSFDSGPSTAFQQLCFHDRSLNGPPRHLCVPDSERRCLLLGIEAPCYTMYTQQRVWNLAFAIRKCTKNMTSTLVRVGICAALFSGAMNCLSPTPSWHSPCDAL